MIPRLRSGISRLCAAAAARFRRKAQPAKCPVKGHVRNIIVVKPPDPRFKEIIFVLKEDYFMGPELNRQELLLQARDVAREYVQANVPYAKRSFPPLLAALLTAAVFAVLHFSGIM